MNKREKTMKHDEKEIKKQWKMMIESEKNNETWWKGKKKQGNMMKNRDKTMKNDETEKKTMKNDDKERKNTLKNYEK